MSRGVKFALGTVMLITLCSCDRGRLKCYYKLPDNVRSVIRIVQDPNSPVESSIDANRPVQVPQSGIEKLSDLPEYNPVFIQPDGESVGPDIAPDDASFLDNRYSTYGNGRGLGLYPLNDLSGQGFFIGSLAEFHVYKGAHLKR